MFELSVFAECDEPSTRVDKKQIRREGSPRMCASKGQRRRRFLSHQPWFSLFAPPILPTSPFLYCEFFMGVLSTSFTSSLTVMREFGNIFLRFVYVIHFQPHRHA